MRALRTSRRSLLVAIVLCALVVAGATTLGVETTHALTGPDTATATTTTAAVGSASPPTTTGPTDQTPGATSAQTDNASLFALGTPPAGAAPPAIPPVAGGSSVGAGGLNGVSCATATTCIAVGANAAGAPVIAATADAGAHWSAQEAPGRAGALEAVNCPTTSHCVAGGATTLLTTTDGGSTWSFAPTPPSTTILGLACPGATVCLAVGLAPTVAGPEEGVLVRSGDGGATWSSISLPYDTAGLDDVACPTATRCIAAGATLLVSSDAGRTWSHRYVLTGTVPLRSLTCPTATHCVALGANPLGVVQRTVSGLELATSDAGTTWSKVSLPAGSGGVDQVACPTTARCIAAGARTQGAAPLSVVTSTDGGATWTAGTPPGIGDVAGLSCPTQNACVLVGRSGAGHVVSASGTDLLGSASWVLTSLGGST